MPRLTVVCPICSVKTDRPPQHLRKHKVPEDEIAALVKQARERATHKVIDMQQITELLPEDRPITLGDVISLVESIGCIVTGKV